MIKRTRFLAPKRLAVAISRIFGRSHPTIIVVEQEKRGKVVEIASYVQDFGDHFSEGNYEFH